MMRTLTLIENRKEDGKIEYIANGDLPLEVAAAALVSLAFYTIPPKKEPLNEGVTPV
jgi:hypothetical protein